MPVGVQAPRERAQLAPRLVCKRGHVGEARVLQGQAADELPGCPVCGGMAHSRSCLCPGALSQPLVRH